MDLYELFPLVERIEYFDACIEILNEEWPRSAAMRSVSMQKALNDNPPMAFGMLDKESGELVGHARLCPLPNNSEGCWLESLVVKKARRCSGIGKRLMLSLEAEATKRGFRTIFLSTLEQQQFYAKLGYSPQQTMTSGNDMSPASTGITRVSGVEPLIYENIFGERQRSATSISPEQALIHLLKVMMGAGMLSLPFAFRHAGLWLGLLMLGAVCVACTYCCHLLLSSSEYLCRRKGQPTMDYANVMRGAIELGPQWVHPWSYFAKLLVNISLFTAQLGFCCVYFVFMADNLKQFFDETSQIRISVAGWIALLLVPTLALCTIRHLKALAPLALLANVVYIVAVAILVTYLVTHLRPVNSVKAFGDISDLPLSFGTMVFAFEGIAVILPIANQMDQPQHFASANGVLNTASLLVLAIYTTIGFYGYLAFGEITLDTITLNLPSTQFFQVLRLMLVGCVLVSYPLQFYVPMERIEKWISKKVEEDKQNMAVYTLRYTLVIITCLMAELIPHLALFISLVGAFAGTSLALIFPPMIDLLCQSSRNRLTMWTWARDIALLGVGILGFSTGTYSSIVQIIYAFGKEDDL